MVARRRSGAAEARKEEPEEAQETVRPGELEEGPSQGIDRFFSGLVGEGQEIHVYRTPEKGDRRHTSYLFHVDRDATSRGELLDTLRDEYGGGRFRLEGRDNDLIVLATSISVEAPKKHLPGREPEPPREREREEVHHHSGAELGDVLELMERSNAQHRELVQSLLQAIRPPSDQGGIKELIEGLAGLQALQPKPASGGNLKEFLEVYQLIESLKGGDGGGGSTGWDLMRSALREFGPMVAGALPAVAGGGLPRLSFEPQPAAAAAPQTPGDPRGSPGESPGSSSSSQAAAGDVMQRQLELLIAAATGDRNPETYADVAIDQIGVELAYRVFIEPAGWESFKAHVPQAQQYAAWFEEFRSALAELIEAEQREGQHVSTQTDGQAADPGHADGPAAGGGGGAQDAQDHGAPGGGGEDGSGDSGARA